MYVGRADCTEASLKHDLEATGDFPLPIERTASDSLIDVLDRVLDKGVVVDAWVPFLIPGLSPDIGRKRRIAHPAPDLRLWATIKAGLDGSDVWLLKIGSDGAAEIYDRRSSGPGGESRFAVSLEQRRVIVRAVQAADFLDLARSLEPERLRASVDSLSLSIKLDARTRTVNVFEPQSVTGPDVARFRRVWDAVMAACPSLPPHRFGWPRLQR